MTGLVATSHAAIRPADGRVQPAPDAVCGQHRQPGKERDDAEHDALAADLLGHGQQHRQAGRIGRHDRPFVVADRGVDRPVAERRERPLRVRPRHLRDPGLLHCETALQPEVGLADVAIRVRTAGHPRAAAHRDHRRRNREQHRDHPRVPGNRVRRAPRGSGQPRDWNPATQQEVATERHGRDHQHALRIVRPDPQAGDRRDEAAGQRDPDRPEQRRAGNRQQGRPYFRAGCVAQGEHLVAAIVCCRHPWRACRASGGGREPPEMLLGSEGNGSRSSTSCRETGARI